MKITAIEIDGVRYESCRQKIRKCVMSATCVNYVNTRHSLILAYHNCENDKLQTRKRIKQELWKTRRYT